MESNQCLYGLQVICMSVCFLILSLIEVEWASWLLSISVLSYQSEMHSTASWNGVLEVRQCVRNWGQGREGKKKKKSQKTLGDRMGRHSCCAETSEMLNSYLLHTSNSAIHLLPSISIYNLQLTCLISWIFWASCYSVDLCSQKRFCEAINEIPMIFIWLPLSCIWIKLLLKLFLASFN